MNTEIVSITETSLTALENLTKPDPRGYYTSVSDSAMGWFLRTGGLRLLAVSNALNNVSVCLDQTQNGGFVAEWSSSRKVFNLEISPAEQTASWTAYYLDDNIYEEGSLEISEIGGNAWLNIVEKIEGFFQ